MQVLDEGVLVSGLDHDVIDVRFNVAAQLRPKARLHRALEVAPTFRRPKGIRV